MKKNQIRKRLHAIGFVDNPISGTFFNRNISVKVLGNDIRVYDKGKRLNFLPNINTPEEKLRILQNAQGLDKAAILKGAKKVSESNTSNQKSTSSDLSKSEYLKSVKKVSPAIASVDIKPQEYKQVVGADNIDMSLYTVDRQYDSSDQKINKDVDPYNELPYAKKDEGSDNSDGNGNGNDDENGNGNGASSNLSFFEIIKKYKWIVIGAILIIIFSNNKE